MFPIDVLRFSEFRTMRNHLSETLMLNDIQITSDYMSRWVVLKRRVGAVTSQRVLKVLFYVNILQCFFVVENFTANAVSVAIGDNGNRLIFEIWWNFFYDLFSIKNVADVNSIDSFVSKRNMEAFSVVIMKRFRSNWFKNTKGRHVTYNTKGVGNLSSPGCNEINVMSLFNTIPRTKRSHGHKRIQHPMLNLLRNV
jgi:hypothetical protein